MFVLFLATFPPRCFCTTLQAIKLLGNGLKASNMNHSLLTIHLMEYLIQNHYCSKLQFNARCYTFTLKNNIKREIRTTNGASTKGRL